ncbi:MAG: hypothetical protein KDE27_20125 [Planctomycetes bacterium]|nr:hypothetical protein [Planctomycetota bacterium]
METAGALQPVASHPSVTDRGQRQGGRDRGAFERALRRQRESVEDQVDEPVAPLTPRLQVHGPTNRKDGQARHVDVLA